MNQANQIPWGLALAVFMGTLPLLGVIVWNLIDLKVLRSELGTLRLEMRSEFSLIRNEISLIRTELTKLTERVAILEERDRMTHSILKG